MDPRLEPTTLRGQADRPPGRRSAALPPAAARRPVLGHGRGRHPRRVRHARRAPPRRDERARERRRRDRGREAGRAVGSASGAQETRRRARRCASPTRASASPARSAIACSSRASRRRRRGAAPGSASRSHGTWCGTRAERSAWSPTTIPTGAPGLAPSSRSTSRRARAMPRRAPQASRGSPSRGCATPGRRSGRGWRLEPPLGVALRPPRAADRAPPGTRSARSRSSPGWPSCSREVGAAAPVDVGMGPLSPGRRPRGRRVAEGGLGGWTPRAPHRRGRVDPGRAGRGASGPTA
jgi:hypothetical protein